MMYFCRVHAVHVLFQGLLLKSLFIYLAVLDIDMAMGQSLSTPLNTQKALNKNNDRRTMVPSKDLGVLIPSHNQRKHFCSADQEPVWIRRVRGLPSNT